MELPRPAWFSDLYAGLLAGRDLESGRATEAFRDLLAGRVEEPLAAAFLTALRMKPESPAEVAAAALALREQMVRLVAVNGPVVTPAAPAATTRARSTSAPPRRS